MCGIDPFTFKSSSFEPVAKPPPTLQSVLIGNATKSGSSAPNPKQDSGKTCESAKLTFPVGTLAEFLKAIQGCEKNKEALLQDLFTQFKTATTQKVIRNSLNLVADREKKGSGRWVVKNEAWVSRVWNNTKASGWADHSLLHRTKQELYYRNERIFSNRP
jgi:hypothetical protein